jgi:hypothetical protein
MRRLLEPAVRSFLEDVLDPESRGGLDPVAFAGATEDMLDRIAIMPRWLGVGMAALTLTLDTAGGPHHTLPKERRARRVAAWKRSPIGPLRTFVDFYEKMGTFTYYSRLEHAGAHR